MIYTLTLNPSIDYYISLDTLLIGGLNRADAESVRAGGKGINVSLMLNKLGVDSTALGFTGGFTGEEIRRQIRDKGIREEFIDVPGQCSRINVKVMTGTETQLNGRGITVSEEDIALLYGKLDSLNSGDILIMSGAPCRGLDENIYVDIIDRLSLKGVKLILDTSGASLRKAASKGPFLVKPNVDELMELYREEITADRMKAVNEGTDIRQMIGIRREDIIRYAGMLRAAGAKNVLVSMGADGAILVADDGNVYEEPVPPMEDSRISSTIGAGDSLVAGFTAEYFCGSGDYGASLSKGVYAGTLTATGRGI